MEAKQKVKSKVSSDKSVK